MLQHNLLYVVYFTYAKGYFSVPFATPKPSFV